MEQSRLLCVNYHGNLTHFTERPDLRHQRYSYMKWARYNDTYFSHLCEFYRAGKFIDIIGSAQRVMLLSILPSKSETTSCCLYHTSLRLTPRIKTMSKRIAYFANEKLPKRQSIGRSIFFV